MSAATSRPVILVFDDSEICLDLTAVALEDAGYDVVTANSGVEAKTLVEETKPACIVLDVTMPPLDGEQVAAMLTASGDFNVPILLHSDRSIAELEERARGCGADMAVLKTADGTDLIEAIRFLLGR